MLLNIIADRTGHNQRGEVGFVYETMNLYYFVFIMYPMREILKITRILCHALQLQFQDILYAMLLVP